MYKYKYNREEIDFEAQGHWVEIFRELAGHSDAIQQALDNLGTTKHTWCPIHHGENGDAYRMFPDFPETGMSICNTCGTFNPYRLLMELNGWSFPETLQAIAQVLGIAEGERPVIQKQEKQSSSKKQFSKQSSSPEEDQKLLDRLRKTWQESLPLDHKEAEPARLYFVRRGLSFETFLSCGSLRFHPKLPYFNDKKEKEGEYPTLLGVLQNAQGKGITFHRIYITIDGKKAPVPKPKKMMAYPSDRSVCGAGVYLGFAPGDQIESIGVAEGIETALAVREATGLPMIAATNAILLEKLEIPPSVKQVTVWGDYDENGRGEKAVRALCLKLKEQGVSVIGLIPPKPELFRTQKSWDWNDVLVHLGPHNFGPSNGQVIQF